MPAKETSILYLAKYDLHSLAILWLPGGRFSSAQQRPSFPHGEGPYLCPTPPTTSTVLLPKTLLCSFGVLTWNLWWWELFKWNNSPIKGSERVFGGGKERNLWVAKICPRCAWLLETGQRRLKFYSSICTKILKWGRQIVWVSKKVTSMTEEKKDTAGKLNSDWCHLRTKGK